VGVTKKTGNYYRDHFDWLLKRQAAMMELYEDERAARVTERVGADGTDRIAVSVFSGSTSDVPPTLVGFAGWLGSIIRKVPEAEREKATFDIRGDEDGARLEVEYHRDETDAERKERVRRANRYLARQRKQDEAAYEALKERLGK
jgi:hypothetical protein